MILLLGGCQVDYPAPAEPARVVEEPDLIPSADPVAADIPEPIPGSKLAPEIEPTSTLKDVPNTKSTVSLEIAESETPNVICTHDEYNCANFKTQNEAQTVYETCGGVDNDVHRLDRDKDGLACENNP